MIQEPLEDPDEVDAELDPLVDRLTEVTMPEYMAGFGEEEEADLPAGMSEEDLAEATAEVMALQRERMSVPERLILAEEGREGTALAGALVPTQESKCPFREFMNECGAPDAHLVACKGREDVMERCMRYGGDSKGPSKGKFIVICRPEAEITQRGD